MATNLPLPFLPIPSEHKPLFKSTNAYVHTYMSQPGHDNSHDYQHILRVLSNANLILQAEQASNPTHNYDTTTVFLAALLHDVGDHKYAKPGEDTQNQVANALLQRGAPNGLAQKIQIIVNNVGYTNETKYPEAVAEALEKYPELAIVQDADRLDAIGAVGIGRCFAYGGAKTPERRLDGAVEHFEEKLYRLGGMMKTVAGREMAVKRTGVLREFAEQFGEEARLSFVLE